MTFGVQRSTFSVFKVALRILSSKVFLLWLMGCWVVFYVTIAVWTNETFAQFAENLRNNPLVQFPFVLFLVGGYLNIVRAARERIQQGKARLFAWMVLPLGIMVFLTGFFISITTRQFEWPIVGEGHIVTPGWAMESYRITGVRPGIRERFLDIDVGRGKGIFSYEPKLTMTDSSSKTYEVGAFPPTKIDDTYYHILNFGLAPGVSLSEGGSVKDQGYTVLRILGPGSSDYFEIPPYPYRFLVSLEPEKTFQKGSLRASEFNLKSPTYKVRVFEGEKVIAEGISKEGIRFDNLTLSFFEPTFWIQLEAVKDPGLPVILTGLALVLAGIPLWTVQFLIKLLASRKGLL